MSYPHGLNEVYIHITSPESRNNVVWKTANVSTNISTMFAAAWTVNLATIVLATLDATSQTGMPWMVCSTTNVQATVTRRHVFRRVSILLKASWSSHPCLEVSSTLPVCIQRRHIGPSPRVMVRGANYQSFLVRTDSTLNSDHLPFIWALWNSMFQVIIHNLMLRYWSDFPWSENVQLLPWLARSLYLSPVDTADQ